MDVTCIGLCLADGVIISVDTMVTKNEVVDNMYKRSELAYLIYNGLS